MSWLLLEQVSKRFGPHTVIHDVSFSVANGEFVVFVGPSGCGKSTLLRMIAGLETISDGIVRIDQQVMNAVPAAQRGIAMVFQSYALYPHMNVYQNMAFALETARVPKAEIESRVRRAAGILKLEALLERRPKQLSGGQRQRVAIGRAIVREPKLFLFDEPLSNLDAELRVQMRVEIAKLHQQLGNTMIYVTHDQVEAMTMADKIVVLHDGRIEQVGSPLELYNTPANHFVAGFIGSPKMNFFRATATSVDENAGITVGGNFLSLPHVAAQKSRECNFGVRPEHIRLGGAGMLLGEAKVELVEHLGGCSLVYGVLSDGQTVTAQFEGQQKLSPGEFVPLHIDPKQAHLFAEDGLRIAPF